MRLDPNRQIEQTATINIRRDGRFEFRLTVCRRVCDVGLKAFGTVIGASQPRCGSVVTGLYMVGCLLAITTAPHTTS
jgi:hypothetical protein